VEPPAGRPLPRRLIGFVGERFPPLAYGPLIVAFVACGSVAAAAASGRPLSLIGAVGAGAVVTLAFFRMRLLDELKDLQIDRLGRPWRPLPRGLVSVSEVRTMARLALLFMTAGAAMLGPRAFAAYLLSAAFLILAGKDFFAASWLPPRPLLYALVHSPAVPLLLFFTWAAQPAAVATPALGWLLMLGWATGLGMEIGRKIVAPAEERPFVETYSASLGRPRAVLLAAALLFVASMGLAGQAASSDLPGWLEWAGIGLGSLMLPSWFVLRRARGAVIEAWAGASALLVLVLPTVAAVSSGVVW
jgi:4-hydroxybenzoate polyprenyltransferase